MAPFVVGEKVTIRFGKYEGKQGTVLKCQQAAVYTVRIEDGIILHFSAKGLTKQVSVP